jgi:diacylglycerol O-acyltransferase / wax synthase
VRVGVAIYSYDGGLSFGVTGDYDSATDVGVLAQGIERAMTELTDLAQAPQPGRPRGRAPKRGPATAQPAT